MKQSRYFAVIAVVLSMGAGVRVSAQGSQGQVPTMITPLSSATEDSVKAAVNRLFVAMKNSDGDSLKAAFTDSAILQTIYTDNAGKTKVHSYAAADFAAIVSRLPNGAADERVQFDVVKFEGPLAIVWANYRFYYNGQFTHCGIDSFQLMRVDGVWKILYIVDTRQKDCQ
jgi:hypothetical protein